MYARKTDGNHVAIMAALRRLSECSVVDLSQCGRGVPDLLVGRHGATYLLEVKNADGKTGHRKIADRAEFDPEGELTDAQVEWLSSWHGCVVRIVHDEEEALRAVAVTEREVQEAMKEDA